MFSNYTIQVKIFLNEDIKVKVTLKLFQNGILTLKMKDINSKQRKSKKEQSNSIEQKNYYEITLVHIYDSSIALYLLKKLEINI